MRRWLELKRSRHRFRAPGARFVPRGSVTMTYSGPGQVTGEQQSLSGLDNVVLSQTWNADGTRASLAVNIGGSLDSDGTVSGGSADLLNTYGYDYLGEMTSIAQTSQEGYSNVTDKYAAMGYSGGELVAVNTYLAASDESSYEVMREVIAYNGDSQVANLSYTDWAGGESGGGMLAGYHYAYDPDGQVETFWSYNDTADTADRTSSYNTWAYAVYEYSADQEVEGA